MIFQSFDETDNYVKVNSRNYNQFNKQDLEHMFLMALH